MSMFRSITMDGQRYTFYCDSWDTRSGFAHKCEMFSIPEGGVPIKIAEEKCYYLNRTWEMWHYQSAVLGAIYKARDHAVGRVIDELKARNGWKKLNAKRRKIAIDAVDNDAEFKTLSKVMDVVNSYCPAWD